MNNFNEDLKEILDYSLYISDTLDNKHLLLLDKLVNYLNKDNYLDIINNSKVILNDNNKILYNKYISSILDKISIKDKDNLLKNLSYEETISIWDNLSNKEKQEYLSNKFISIIDIKRINHTIYNNIDFLKILIDSNIIKKIPDNSLILPLIKNKYILSNTIIKKISNDYITTYINKFHNTYKSFKKLISKTDIVKYASNFSLNVLIDKDTLIKYPYSIYKIKTNITTNILDIDSLNNLINNDYLLQVSMVLDNKKIRSIFNDKYILNRDNHTIYLYPFNELKEYIDIFKNDYNYLNKLSYSNIVFFINTKFNEEEKITLLRNNNFINDTPTNYLNIILSNMRFSYVFNMLQRKDILDKVSNIKLNITSIDTPLIKGYLDIPKLINITSKSSIKDLFKYIDKEDTIKYISYPYIYTKLNKKDIIDILVDKHINIFKSIDKFITYLDKYYLIEYINRYIKDDDSILYEDYVIKNILEYKGNIDIDSIHYLIDKIKVRNNNLIIKDYLNIDSFKSIIVGLNILGFININNLIDKGNTSITMDNINTLENIYLKNFGNNTYIKKRFMDKVCCHYKLNSTYKDELINIYSKCFYEEYGMYVIKANLEKYILIDIDTLNKKIDTYLENTSINRDTLYNIVIPIYLKTKDISNVLEYMGYSKPAYYNILIKEKEERKELSYINNRLNKYFSKHIYSANDKEEILKYIVYGNNIKVDNIIRNIKRKIDNLNGKVDIDDYSKSLYYVSIVNLVKEDSLDEYNTLYNEIDKIIKYLVKLGNTYIDKDKLKNNYYKEYDNYISKVEIPIDINKDYLELINRKMTFSDFTYLFNGIDINKKIIIDNNVMSRLIEIIPYIIDGYLSDYTNKYDRLFADSVTLKDMDTWDKIVKLLIKKP